MDPVAVNVFAEVSSSESCVAMRVTILYLSQWLALTFASGQLVRFLSSGAFVWLCADLLCTNLRCIDLRCRDLLCTDLLCTDLLCTDLLCTDLLARVHNDIFYNIPSWAQSLYLNRSFAFPSLEIILLGTQIRIHPR